MPKYQHVPALLFLLALIALGYYSVYRLRPPQALPVQVSEQVFSAGRAFRHVQNIAQQPHAMGTAAHRAVRNYLLQELEKLEVQPQVQEATVASDQFGRTAMGYVHNVISVLKGSSNGKAVLLMAHYDSQPNALGAGDDGAGIAAILEIVRSLKAGSRLKNDVILLFTDGEEYGLFGAKAFLRHPLLSKVGVVINIEGRGNSGPSLTFEVSPENGWLVEQLQRAPYPVSSSLMYEVYRHLPNDTDFSVLRQAGFSGINSALIDGYVHYHKLTDNPENLNQNSLQHHGSNALALTRHFGNISLNQTKAPDKVFFNLVGSWLVQYAGNLNQIWLFITVGVIALLLILGFKNKVFTIGQVSKGFLFYMLLVMVVAGVFLLINKAVLYFMPFQRAQNGVYGSDLFYLAYLLLALGLFLLGCSLISRWTSDWGLVAGAYLFILILTAGLYYSLPSSVYILLFPLLFSSAAGVVVLGFKWQQQSGLAYLTIIFLGILPALFMLVPLATMLSVLFALQLPIVTVLILLLLWGFGLPILLYLSYNLSLANKFFLPLLILLGGGLLTIYAIISERPGKQQPLHTHVSYYLDADKRKAYWASAYTQSDSWNKQFFPNATTGTLQKIYPAATQNYLLNTAAIIQAAPPEARLLSDSVSQGQRQLILLLRSPRQAAQLQIYLLTGTQNSLLAARLNNEKISNTIMPTKEGYLLATQLFGLPDSKEVKLNISLKQTEKVRLVLYDRSIGLPEHLIKIKRPATVIPDQGINNNLTVIKKTYSF